MKKHLDKALFVLLILATAAILYNSFVGNTKIIDGGTPWSSKFNNGFGCNTEDITNMYAGYIEEWKMGAKSAFDKAEKEVYKVAPTPDILAPNEDPAKCPCKGSGIIVHGDGHKTLCPYHSGQFNSKNGKLKASGKLIIIEN